MILKFISPPPAPNCTAPLLQSGLCVFSRIIFSCCCFGLVGVLFLYPGTKLLQLIARLSTYQVLGGMSQSPAAVTKEIILELGQHCLGGIRFVSGEWSPESGRAAWPSLSRYNVPFTCSHNDFPEDKLPAQIAVCFVCWPGLSCLFSL